MDTSQDFRLALYAIPEPGAPLWTFGCSVLGYDPHKGRNCRHVPFGDFSDTQLEAFTAAPRKYGFHATLKPPFRLASGKTENDVLEALTEFTSTRAVIDLGRLEVAKLGSFLALTAPQAAEPLAELGAKIVTQFDEYRAPLTEQEFARRNPERLTERQRSLLRQWGYPFVLDEFRFHMTLTGQLSGQEIEQVQHELTKLYSSIDEPVRLRHIALCRQDRPEANFRIVEIRQLVNA